MAISNPTVPSGMRTHGAYIGIDNTLAGATSTEFKVVMFGQRLTTGAVDALVPTRVSDPNQAGIDFGIGSMLHDMCKSYLDANSTIPLYVIALDDDPAGNQAAGTITVDAAASEAGTLYIYIGDESVSVGIAASDDANTIATNIAAAINAETTLSVTATVSTNTVTVTARHKGEAFNKLQLHANYYDEPWPKDLALTFADLSGGTGNPALSDAIDAMGDEWYNWVICPYKDTANLNDLKQELDDRYSALEQKGGRAFTAFNGTLSETGTFGELHNSPHLTVMGTNKSPTPVHKFCAIDAGIAAYYLANDPARPLQTLALPGVLAPKQDVRWTRSERDQLLYDGIATYVISNDGTCRIERQITTYQTNSSGLPDGSYLDINTPETLERIRYTQRTSIVQEYPRHKLVADGTEYGAGQAIVTPSLIKAKLLTLYKEMELKGWVEDYETYAAYLIVEINADDKTRIDWRDTPNLANQARVFAGLQQFIL